MIGGFTVQKQVTPLRLVRSDAALGHCCRSHLFARHSRVGRGGAATQTDTAAHSRYGAVDKADAAAYTYAGSRSAKATGTHRYLFAAERTSAAYEHMVCRRWAVQPR